jgi:hypothetical protein
VGGTHDTSRDATAAQTAGPAAEGTRRPGLGCAGLLRGLQIVPDGEDAAPAQDLGWTAGIPGAEVTITAGEDVVGFMTQTVVKRGNATVQVPASRRHSIVVSEWSFFREGIPGVGGYDFGGYLELANKSDTTVYLDGLIIGSACTQATESTVPNTCAAWRSSATIPAASGHGNSTPCRGLCAHLVHSNFERRQAPRLESHIGAEWDAGRWSVQRRVAITRSDGRKILQHTRTTDADFFLGLRTPFQLP